MDSKKIKKVMKKLVKNWKPLLFILLVLSVVILVSSLSFLLQSGKRGREIGNLAGTAAGIATGSYDGWTKGYEEGREEGLQAEDTFVAIRSALEDSGKLHVLNAKVVLENDHIVGEMNEEDALSSLVGGKKYEALYLYDGEISFSVDLSQAKVNVDNGRISVEIPLPEAILLVDEKNPQKIADYTRKWGNGSMNDGIEAYNNSMKQLKAKSLEELSYYNSFMVIAKETAENQIKALVKAVDLKHREPEVIFKDGGN